LPLKGSLAETYLRSRQCFLDTPNLRFLEGGKHPPAMIGRFSSGAVHLTRLNADGTGKAGTENDKLMFGRVASSPLVIGHAGPDTPLIICEGIEDGLSMVLATGFLVWVAGSASMMPKLIPASTTHRTVYFALDLDKAGFRAYRRALELRTDIHSVRFPKQLDANAIIRQPEGTKRLRELVLRRPTFHR
jgi:DNA primase